MPRPLFRALAALFIASSLHAQNVRVTGALTTTLGPTVTGFGAPTIMPMAPSLPMSAASMAPSLTFATLAPAPIVAQQAALTQPIALAALEVVNPAASRPDSPNRRGTPIGAFSALAATPADGWASRFNFQPGEQFFDGGRPIVSESGAVFAAIQKPDGRIRVHLLERAPLAATKAVPGTEGLAGKPLLDALTAISARGHQARGYSETSDFMFSTADQITINGVKGVIDAYSGIFVPGTSKDGGDYPERGDQNGDGHSDRTGMNVEHTWPQSLFNKALPERSDIHHLMATFMHPNSVRGHMPFGIVTGRADYSNKAGAKRGNGVFEPPDAVKGLVARKQLYFYARHKNSRMFGRTSVVYWNQQIELFMKWNREFPPDAVEMRRNDLGQQWQGNRNPFIDDHLLADRIGAEAFRAGNPSRGANLTGDAKPSGRGRRSSRR